MGKQKSRRREASIARHQRAAWREVKVDRKLLARKHERGAHESKPILECEACLGAMPSTQLNELLARRMG